MAVPVDLKGRWPGQVQQRCLPSKTKLCPVHCAVCNVRDGEPLGGVAHPMFLPSQPTHHRGCPILPRFLAEGWAGTNSAGQAPQRGRRNLAPDAARAKGEDGIRGAVPAKRPSPGAASETSPRNRPTGGQVVPVWCTKSEFLHRRACAPGSRSLPPGRRPSPARGFQPLPLQKISPTQRNLVACARSPNPQPAQHRPRLSVTTATHRQRTSQLFSYACKFDHLE